MVQELQALGIAKVYIKNSQALPIPLHRTVCSNGESTPEGNATGKEIISYPCGKEIGLNLKVQRGRGSRTESFPDILNQPP